MKSAEFSMTLRGQEVTIRGQIEPADESVGIQATLAGFDIWSEDGDKLDWDVTEDEQVAIDEAFFAWLDDSDDDGYTAADYPDYDIPF